MRIKKYVTRIREETTDVLCNKCEKSLIISGEYEGLEHAYGRGGCSSEIGNGIEWAFALCEECLLELFSSFKISAFDPDNLV